MSYMTSMTSYFPYNMHRMLVVIVYKEVTSVNAPLWCFVSQDVFRRYESKSSRNQLRSERWSYLALTNESNVICVCVSVWVYTKLNEETCTTRRITGIGTSKIGDCER